MLDKFVPDLYAQSIYRIDYKKLKKKGIELVIFDLDNTIATYEEKRASKEATELMFKIKDLGLTPILMTNSGRERGAGFRDSLEIDTCASAKKPLKRSYIKVMNLYKKTPEKIACVGDQLLTDVYGANKMGMTSILINPLSKKDRKVTYFNRFIEKILFFILDKREIFKKGKYYD